jgi:hypothetical protein
MALETKLKKARQNVGDLNCERSGVSPHEKRHSDMRSAGEFKAREESQLEMARSNEMLWANPAVSEPLQLSHN